MLLVLDASVAIKWFVAEEIGHSEAIGILDQVRDRPSSFVVPELFYNEMLAVLARLVDDRDSLKLYLEALQDLGMERIGNGRELLDAAADLACQYGVTGYDAVYAATAQLTAGCWLTADLRAHRKVQRLRISRAVCQ